MTICKSFVAILALSTLAFPFAVLVVADTDGERKTEPSARTLKRFEDANIDEITDDDLRAAMKLLVAQVRELNERVEHLENPQPDVHLTEPSEPLIPPAKSFHPSQLKISLDVGLHRFNDIGRELNQAVQDVGELQQEIVEKQAQLKEKRNEVTRLRQRSEEVKDELQALGREIERAERK